MGSTASNTAPSTALDTEGVSSVLTSPQSAADPAWTGAAFRPDILAAGRLVHVHASTQANAYLAVFSETWIDATPHDTLPGEYTAKTVDPRPSAFWTGVGVPTAKAGAIHEPGRLHAREDFRVISGASNGPLMVLLATVAGAPLLARYRVQGMAVQFLSSEWVAPSAPRYGETVVWDRGVHISGDYLYVFGSRSSGQIFVQKRLLVRARQVPLCLSATGWTPDTSEMVPMPLHGGSDLLSSGPVSVARYGTEWYLLTNNSGTARAYRAVHPLSGWRSLATTFDMHSDSQAAARFHPAVSANPNAAELADTSRFVAGLPLSFTSAQGNALRTRWRLLGVPRQRL